MGLVNYNSCGTLRDSTSFYQYEVDAMHLERGWFISPLVLRGQAGKFECETANEREGVSLIWLC